MKKRVVLLVGVMLTLSIAPAAMASHCYVCRWFPSIWEFDCVSITSSTNGGWEFCETDGSSCQTSGNQCAPHGGGLAPLAAEFTVASVERLDEPRTDAGETLIASIVSERSSK